MNLTEEQTNFIRGLLHGPAFLSASERGNTAIGNLIVLGYVDLRSVSVPFIRPVRAYITPEGEALASNNGITT